MLRCKISPGIAMTNVRFGSKADIVGYQRDVCFTPKSGHWLSASGRPLWADFVAEVGDYWRLLGERVVLN
jgi:hypothetical protein